MTFLVELPKEAYPANALDGFEVRSDFKLENAQAMMWLSQLAYETADQSKIDDRPPEGLETDEARVWQ